MNPCTRFAPMIGARPGELSEDETRALTEHLAACDACQARLADETALSGMLSEALMDEANGRDFAAFADGVMERIPEHAARVHGERSGILSRLAAWVRRHRAAAFASALAPVAAAVLVVYLTVGTSGPPEQQAALDVNVGDRGALVLDTSDGPIVLLGNSDSEGS